MLSPLDADIIIIIIHNASSLSSKLCVCGQEDLCGPLSCHFHDHRLSH